jgi:hypothetical protein
MNESALEFTQVPEDTQVKLLVEKVMFGAEGGEHEKNATMNTI